MIRIRNEGDAAAIAAIQARSPDAAPWTPESVAGAVCEVAVLEGAAAGFIVWRETAPGEREILNLAVDPRARRLGIGRRLVERVLEARGECFLEVRESNHGARAFYRTLGFRDAGTRMNYYSGPAENGIVMKFSSW
jgi:ribosomal-protein-alanine N-acetyltransferase